MLFTLYLSMPTNPTIAVNIQCFFTKPTVGSNLPSADTGPF